MSDANVWLSIDNNHDAPPEMIEARAEIRARRARNPDRPLIWLLLLYLAVICAVGPLISPNATRIVIRARDTAIDVTPAIAGVMDRITALDTVILANLVENEAVETD
ncbi:MAG: hypothetical protein KC897_05080, partial [Candidatus Omnitrophica bacterium]|nr:hypothetical protein [Candidatus Omnitrophota bacterium]